MFAIWFDVVVVIIYVVNMWLLYSCYVVAIWLICGYYVVAMRLLCYAVAIQ